MFNACGRARRRPSFRLLARTWATTDLAPRTRARALEEDFALRTNRRRLRTIRDPPGHPPCDTAQRSARAERVDARCRANPECRVRAARRRVRRVRAPALDCLRPSLLRFSNICRAEAVPDPRIPDRACPFL